LTREQEAQALTLGKRVTLVGFWVNLLLGGLKVGVGLAAGSRALVADGVHSFSDLLTDLLVLLGLEVGRAPSDSSHPYGHGRFESLGALAVGAVLAVVAGGILLDALEAAFSGKPAPPGAGAILAAAAGLLSKEALYQWTAHAARRIQSDLLLANAWHHRSDALSSLAVLFGLAGASLGAPILDPVAAALVAFMVAHAAWKVVRPALGKLTDEALPKEELQGLLETARRVEGVREVHDLRARWMGGLLLVDLHVLVDPDLTVSEGHRVGEALRAALASSVPHLAEAIVHVEPEEHGTHFELGPSREEIRRALEELLGKEDPARIRSWEILSIHYREGKVTLDLLVELPPSWTLEEARREGRALEEKIRALPWAEGARIFF